MSSEPVLPFKPGYQGASIGGRPLVVRRFRRGEAAAAFYAELTEVPVEQIAEALD